MAEMASEPDERTIAKLIAEALPELRLANDLVRSYVQYTCDRISSRTGKKDWYRLAGETRIKDADSIRRQLGQKGLGTEQVWTIDDIVGARVVVLTLTDATELAEYILGDGHPFAELERHEMQGDDGYRAVHLKGRLPTKVADIGCELQIRTALQDAWAVVSRGGLYGAEDTTFVSASAKALSEQLAGADKMLDLIRTELRRPDPMLIEHLPRLDGK